MKRLVIMGLALALAGCGHDIAGGASGVNRIGDGIYQASEMNAFGIDVQQQAVRQCEIEGKRPTNLVPGTKQGMASGREYATLMFQCG